METPKRPISPDGMEKLKQEWEELWYRTRPKLLEEIAAAAAQGDRSENAEYIYGKKRLREIDKRLRQLDDKVGKSVVVEGRASDTISFGARVRMRRADGREMVVRIVGADEIDPMQGLLSMDSPIGKSLLGKPPKGNVEVATPRGPVAYEIIEVDYP